MIRVVVFSRDRALQLQATLASLRLQAPDAAEASVSVLYRVTTDRHARQYDRLATELAASARFVREEDFRAQLLDLLGAPSGGSKPGSRQDDRSQGRDHCMFLVDDSLFVHPFGLQDTADALDSNRDALGFSLRLGRNTTICYAENRPQRLPTFQELGGNVLKYRWNRSDGDFGYPLELSSSLYPLERIADLIQTLDFDGPSSLESQMSLRARDFARKQPALLCFSLSAAFSAPLNRVQEVFPNRTGSSQAYSTESLADLFDSGKRIDVGAMNGFVPDACHQEIRPQFG